MSQPTCTCSDLNPQWSQADDRVQCPLCKAAPKMYAALEHVRKVHPLDSCPRVTAALDAARGEV